MKALTQLPDLHIGQPNNTDAAVKKLTTAFVGIFHNGFAVIGLAIALAALLLAGRPNLRYTAETKLLSWLQVRHTVDTAFGADHLEPAEVTPLEIDASDRATATDPADLPKQQANVAYWISKKYRVAPEPVAALVAEAYAVGTKTKLDPTLILAIMAIESGFNPFAQSPVGAQGLMQVMTKIHSDKYENFGGELAAFDPLTNLRVGVKVLQESISRAGGSISGGLKQYVGAANLAHDDGYGAKVLAEYNALHLVATGKPAPVLAPQVTTSTAAAKLPAPAAGNSTMKVPMAPLTAQSVGINQSQSGLLAKL